MWRRAIIHFDLDAFYASVEQLRDPSLRGRPVIVGGGPDENGNASLRRGVVSAASYEARKFGVRSAMPLATALRLCPSAAVVPVDFVAYRKASAAVFAIVADATPVVEPTSLDEAFLDVTGSQAALGPPEAIARRLRDRIDSDVHLNTSFGVATSKVVAKIASDLRKPRGFVVVEPGTEAALLAPLPLRSLPGLGPATETALAGLGLSTLGDIAALPRDILTRRLGAAQGMAVWQRSQGIDESPVTVPGDPKSISREETFDDDISDALALSARLAELADDVARRLRAAGLRAATITIKLRYGDFSTLSRQHTLEAATDSASAVAEAARSLLLALWDGRPVRLLGVGSSGFENSRQLDLFADVANRHRASRDSRVDRTLDDLQARFGTGIVRRGGAGSLRDLDFRGDDLRAITAAGADEPGRAAADAHDPGPDDA